MKGKRMNLNTIDLNADLGEGYGSWRMTDDEGLLQVVSSANVACGGHAGDGSTMRAVCRTAAQRGVRVGAHVAYDDRGGFGRRFVDIEPSELEDLVLYQLAALTGIARAEGTAVAYCKPHGALYNTIAKHEAQATAVAAAIAALSPGLAVLGLPGSVWLHVATQHGLRPVGEAFADRAYRADGSLVPRNQPGAVLHDADEIARRVCDMVRTGCVTAITGEHVPIDVGSVCVHGDTPGAVQVARAVRSRLEADGVAIQAFAAPPGS